MFRAISALVYAPLSAMMALHRGFGHENRYGYFCVHPPMGTADSNVSQLVSRPNAAHGWVWSGLLDSDGFITSSVRC